MTERALETPANGKGTTALAGEVVRIHRHYFGRGPAEALAFTRNDVVVVLLRDVLTEGEHTLLTAELTGVARRGRRELAAAMRGDLVAAVERHTRRRVISVLTDTDFDADVAAGMFVLDRPAAGDFSA